MAYNDNDEDYGRQTPGRSTIKVIGVVLGVVCALVFVGGAICWVKHCRKKRHPTDPKRPLLNGHSIYASLDRVQMKGLQTNGIQTNGVPTSERNHDQVDPEDVKRLIREVEKRKEEERWSHPDYKRIWFVKHVAHGNLSHWAIGIEKDGVLQKHQLRRIRREERQAASGLNDPEHPDPAGRRSRREADTADGEYAYSISKWNLDMERRDAMIETKHVPVTTYLADNSSRRAQEQQSPSADLLELFGKRSPDPDNHYYVCLIGWTRLDADRIVEIGRTHLQAIRYNIIFQNCQHFVINFAREIVDKKALDWEWFETNTKTPYQEAVRLMPPLAVVWLNNNGVDASVRLAKDQSRGDSATSAADSATAAFGSLAGAVIVASHAIP